MDTIKLLERVGAVLDTRFPKLRGLSAADYFADHDALSSFEVLDLLLVIETEFDTRIPDIDATEENFGSKGAIAAYLGRHLGAVP